MKNILIVSFFLIFSPIVNANEKNIYLVCLGKSVYEKDDRNLDETKTYALIWQSNYYTLYHENEIVNCFHTSFKIECGRYSMDDKFTVEIDTINGEITQLKYLKVTDIRQLNNHEFRGSCTFKDKKLF